MEHQRGECEARRGEGVVKARDKALEAKRRYVQPDDVNWYIVGAE